MDRLAQAAEYGTDAVVSYDLDGRICRWNAGAEAAFGFSEQEMMGLSLAERDALSYVGEDAVRRPF
ncbi:MAG: PAS domain S-box protein [Solirubrobacteraceae bacterium]